MVVKSGWLNGGPDYLPKISIGEEAQSFKEKLPYAQLYNATMVGD